MASHDPSPVWSTARLRTQPVPLVLVEELITNPRASSPTCSSTALADDAVVGWKAARPAGPAAKLADALALLDEAFSLGSSNGWTG